VLLPLPPHSRTLKLCRAIRGLTQTRLGYLSGIPFREISLVERGRLPTARQLARLSLALGIKESDLLSEPSAAIVLQLIEGRDRAA